MPYFVVLEALRESRECPLCALESACMDRYFDGLLYERVNDPGLRKCLVRSRGYCSRHAHRLLECNDGLGTSILYRDQVRDFTDFFEDMAEHREALRTTQARMWTAHESCPACRLQLDARQRHVQVLLEGLAEPEMRNAFQEGVGVCVPHFFVVMDVVKDVETRRCIIEVMRNKYGELLAEMSELQRKKQWHYAREPIGKEGDSWARAVRMMVGKKGVF